MDKEHKDKFYEELEKLASKDCPCCGRCPTCGRGSYRPWYPYPYEPLNPYPFPYEPWYPYPYTVWTSDNDSGYTTVRYS